MLLPNGEKWKTNLKCSQLIGSAKYKILTNTKNRNKYAKRWWFKSISQDYGFYACSKYSHSTNHLYWYCYGFFQGEKWILAVVDRILTNFQRTAGLFSHPLYTKCFALLLLALSCLGTTGVKNDKITWRKIYIALGIGATLYFGNFWILYLRLPASVVAFFISLPYLWAT